MINVDKSILPDGDIFVAVSGGVDSIVGLHLLHRLLGPRIKACHFNHNLRPRNNVMEKAVEWFCEDNNIYLITGKRIGQMGESFTEAELREFRHKFFAAISDNIVNCHHLDDAVENYMMNCLKGCPENIPIKPVSEFDQFTIYRPFLKSRKEKFRRYAENNFLDEYVVEDETNEDSDHCRRNWIRNEILPQFKDMGLPKVVLKKFYLSES